MGLTMKVYALDTDAVTEITVALAASAMGATDEFVLHKVISIIHKNQKEIEIFDEEWESGTYVKNLKITSDDVAAMKIEAPELLNLLKILGIEPALNFREEDDKS